MDRTSPAAPLWWCFQDPYQRSRLRSAIRFMDMDKSAVIEKVRVKTLSAANKRGSKKRGAKAAQLEEEDGEEEGDGQGRKKGPGAAKPETPAGQAAVDVSCKPWGEVQSFDGLTRDVWYCAEEGATAAAASGKGEAKRRRESGDAADKTEKKKTKPARG